MNPGKTWCQSLQANIHVMKCKCPFRKLASQGTAECVGLIFFKDQD